MSWCRVTPLTFLLENDTLARIGTSCLQRLLEGNINKLSVVKWERIITTFVKLFKTTTPHQLFDERLRIEIDEAGEEIPETGMILNIQSLLGITLGGQRQTAKRSYPRH